MELTSAVTRVGRSSTVTLPSRSMARATAAESDVSSSPYPYYFATATDFSGNESRPAVTTSPTGVEGTPRSWILSISSHPNPFNPEATIGYTVPATGRVVVSIYDARGAHVVTLVGAEKEAGEYTRRWSGTDEQGRAVSAGLCFARVTHPNGTKNHRMALLR